MTTRLLLVLAAALTLASPARAADPTIQDGSAQAALDASRAQWEREELPNYGYRVRTLCFCPSQLTRPYAVHVRDGRPVRSHRYIASLDTVEKLFARIQAAITSGYDGLRATYGARGVPTRIDVNPGFYIFEDETSYVISAIWPEPASLPKRVALSILDGTALSQLRAARERWQEAGRPRRGRVERAYARIAKAIRQRAAVLTVSYGERGVPTRIVTRP